EVEYEEQDSHLWHIRYPGEFGDIVVATTRPETMLGDTGVCVNPNDARYTHMIGKTVTLPLMNRELPIIADEYADLEFGTGAVKMTPAHDPNDFEVAKRHDLPILRVLNDDGTMNENTGRFAGMTREKCRQEVVKELEALGLLVKIEPLHHNVGTCYRCHQNVEPLVSTQWFVKMKPLAEPAIEVARTKELIFVPERFEKTYLNWMENIRDWCISRQLWWGHRIPAFYCDGCGEVAVSREDISTCPKCGGAVRQDEDVLDTWFSSALWPFSTLGWPEETEDLKYFYPNSVLSCGYDIIFFWLARMVFSGIEQMGQCPFRVALMHGLVRDQQGRKMSKSLGNGIDPIEVIEKYGADALRFSLEMGVSPGSDVRMSEEKIESFRNFVNKIWNASRFVLMNLEGFAPKGVPGEEELALCDKWILAKFQECARAVTDNLENFDLGLAATKLYDFVWSEFCDWYIEMAKQGLNGDDALRKKATQEVLYYVLLGTLKLLHPYIPFVTEEVYGFLPGAEGMLITARWPEVRPEFDFAIAAQQMEGVMEVIRTVRNLRAEMNVTPGRRATLILKPHAGWRGALAAAEGYFKRLAFASGVELLEDGAQNPGKSASAVTGPCELFMPLGELVDVEKELQRLEKDRKNVEGEIARAKGKLENGGFVAKAPAHLIEAEREKMALNGKLLEKLEQRIAEMEALR
ncbi:MAG: valine--tRNA ligase, partial [Clostridiales bacterium]|nr:valine--tRNA ligase [Clostridiales bacterium]